MHNKEFSVIVFLFVWCYEHCLCKPATLKHVLPVRNLTSEISHCAEGILFQDSLFCILCVFYWNAWLENQCILWVPWCNFPAQMAFSCCRTISFGLINRASNPTNLLSIPSFIHLLLLCVVYAWYIYMQVNPLFF